MIVRANARHLPFKDGIAQMCVTSPPYWGLRNYGVPSLWGGRDDCDHQWHPYRAIKGNGSGVPEGYSGLQARNLGSIVAEYDDRAIYGKTCSSCGAWFGELGMEPDPRLYIEHLAETFAEVYRVVRNDGTLWVVIGDSYAGSIKGYSANGYSAGEKQASNAGSMQLPAFPRPEGLDSKEQIGIPWLLVFALRGVGWRLRRSIVWFKPNVMPESVIDRPTASHELVLLFSKRGDTVRLWRDRISRAWTRERPSREKIIVGQDKHGQPIYRPRWQGFEYFYDADSLREAHVSFGRRPGNKSREYVARDPHHEASHKKRPEDAHSHHPGGRNVRDVWVIPAHTDPAAFTHRMIAPDQKLVKEKHFATFPDRLVRPCILAGSAPGDLVLDNFLGSGTTGREATKLGRLWLGTEMSWQYCGIARRATADQAVLGL